MAKPSLSTTKKSTSSTSLDNQSDDEIVDVRKVKQRSRASSDLEGQGQSSRSTYNPMEQPRFGKPSNSTYFVTDSQFTSKDVEEIKRFGSKVSSSRAKSECSGSSRRSCPDPPHMNLSPAAYVRQRLNDSESSFASDNVADSVDGVLNENRPVDNMSEHSAQDGMFQTEIDSSNEGRNENETKENNETQRENEAQKNRNKLEESWEEFFKSPVKKAFDETKFKRYQRMESVDREIKEAAIINNFQDIEDNTPDFDVTSKNSKLEITTGFNEERCEDADSQVTDNEGISVISENTGMVAESENVIEINKDTGDLLDISQKLLNELGIEDQYGGSTMGENIVKIEEETISTDDKIDQNVDTTKPIHIEEKIRLDDGDDEEEAEISTPSPKKKKKSKNRSSLDKLRPQLSLSPPGNEPLPPEVSTATAFTVERITGQEGSSYTPKHRLSLPAVSPLHRRSGNKRQSLPNVLEDQSAKNSSTVNSIEEYLYGNGPLEEEKGKQDESHSDGSPPQNNGLSLHIRL